MKYNIDDFIKFTYWEEGYTFEAQGKIVNITDKGYNVQNGQYSYYYSVKDEDIIEQLFQ